MCQCSCHISTVLILEAMAGTGRYGCRDSALVFNQVVASGSGETKPAPAVGASALPACHGQPSTAGKVFDSPAEMLAG